MALAWSIVTAEHLLRIRLSGRLTLGPQLLKFSREVESCLSTHGGQCVLLDMEEVVEIDSSGLGELVIIYTLASQGGNSLGLLRLKERVGRLLEITKLSGLLPQFKFETEALEWIRAKQPSTRGGLYRIPHGSPPEAN